MKKLITFILMVCALIFLANAKEASASNVVYPLSRVYDFQISGMAQEYGYRAYSKPHSYEYFVDAKKNFCVFSLNGEGGCPTVYTMNSDCTANSKLKLEIPSFETFGAFYYGADGNYYVAVGYQNYEENPDKVCVKVHKISPKTGKVLLTAELKGRTVSDRTMHTVFLSGCPEMVQIGSKLYLHMSSTKFKSGGGANHQSAYLYEINTKTMKLNVKSNFNAFYVSHSFRQILKADGKDIIAVSHGDALPRAIRLIKRNSKGETASTDFLPMEGSGNDTGTTVDGLEIGKSSYLVVGNSTAHDNKVNGKSGEPSNWSAGRNIYLEVVKKQGLTGKLVWLTGFDPNNTNIYVGEPKIVKLSDTQFAILYSIRETTSAGKNFYVEYKLVDDTGAVLATKRFDNLYSSTVSTPVLIDNRILWLSPFFSSIPQRLSGPNKELTDEPICFEENKVFAFALNIAKPNDPQRVEGVRPEKIEIQPSNPTITLGGGFNIEYQVYPKNTTFDAVECVSSNTFYLGMSGNWATPYFKTEGNKGYEYYARSIYDNKVSATGTVIVNPLPVPKYVAYPKTTYGPDVFKITSLPTKTTYKRGEPFDPTGFTATYSSPRGVTYLDSRHFFFYVSWGTIPDERDRWAINRPLYASPDKLYVSAYYGGQKVSFEIKLTDPNEVKPNIDNTKVESTGTIITDDVPPDGIYYIRSVIDTNYYIEVSNAGKNAGALLAINKLQNSDNQKFKLTKVARNKYTITALHSGMNWTSPTRKGKQLTQGTVTNKENQTFTITKDSDNTYQINDCIGFFTSVFSGKMEVGTGVGLWSDSPGLDQSFVLEKVQ